MEGEHPGTTGTQLANQDPQSKRKVYAGGSRLGFPMPQKRRKKIKEDDEKKKRRLRKRTIHPGVFGAKDHT